MKFQNIRLGKIGDHISTNRRIKLRENRRNIKLFTNKHKVDTTKKIKMQAQVSVMKNWL
jgi:hypothetical protein